MKRYLYLLLGVISTITPILYFILFKNQPISDTIGWSFVTYLCYFLVSMFWVLIYGLIKDGEPQHPTYNIPFLFWPFALRRKKVYYSDLGYFYISLKDGDVNVYKQTSLMSHFLFHVYFNGDVERLRSDIKKHLDEIYSKELREKRHNKELKDNLKKWDGYIDIKSKRDDKLDKLL